MVRSTPMTFTAAIIIPLLVSRVYCSTSTLSRMTANGPVRGIEKISALGKKYYSFQGVPFAAPPITGTDPFTGESVDRRFKAPEALLYTWTEPLKAYNFSKVCMQQVVVGMVGVPNEEKSEDCLYLNIYVPAGGARKKTVIVFIHGGAFVVGNARDSLYGPDFLLSQDNVVVTVQYRLGIFGFLNLGFFPYTGNMGLKDQQLGLKWIYKNIRYFSGRNDQILLMGQSAGAASVHLQMLNPKSRKYFNRAFAQSGTALVFSVLRKNNQLKQVEKCAQTKNNLPKLIEYLKTADGITLAECYALKSLVYFRSIWIPTRESESVVGAFLTKTPERIYNSNKAPVMDTMFSLTTEETLGMDPYLYNMTEPTEILKENWKELSLQKPCNGNSHNAFPKGYKREFALLKKAYFSDINNHTAFQQENLHFMSDLIFGYSTVRSTELQAQANYKGAVMGEPKKTFLFRFDVNAAINGFAVTTGLKYKGATHVDDLCYEFYDPSIDANTCLVSSNPQQIFHGEVSNAAKTPVKTNIKEQIHYDTWDQVQNIYNGFNCYADYN